MRHSISLLRKILGAGVMCLLPFALSANLAMAQKKVEPLLAACNTTVASGSGEGYMRICISAHGNVLILEGPKGINHMFADGYSLTNCGAINYYDLAQTEAGWTAPNPPVPPGGTLPLTITRSTTDGKFRLVQKFTRNPTERELTIQMTLTNTSGVSLNTSFLSFARFMDFDGNNTGTNDVIDKTVRSVSVHEYDSDFSKTHYHGAQATAISPIPVYPQTMKHPLPPPPACLAGNGTLVATPYTSSDGDDVYGLINFQLGSSMAKGASQVFTMKYQLY